MLFKKSLYLMLFLSLTAFAEESLEEVMKKALEGINEVKVLQEGKSTIISEQIVTLESNESSTTKVDSNTTQNTTLVSKDKTVVPIVQKKKKHVKKRKHKKRRKHRRRKKRIDISQLPMAKTYGVVKVSKPYEGRY